MIRYPSKGPGMGVPLACSRHDMGTLVVAANHASNGGLIKAGAACDQFPGFGFLGFGLGRKLFGGCLSRQPKFRRLPEQATGVRFAAARKGKGHHRAIDDKQQVAALAGQAVDSLHMVVQGFADPFQGSF